jgi:hypothetical protein
MFKPVEELTGFDAREYAHMYLKYKQEIAHLPYRADGTTLR